ncbi:MAG: YceD family protein [Porticoccus sp.]
MLTPPQRNILPQVVDPRRLVNQGVTLAGEINTDLCLRLSESVIEISEPIVANLIFDTAEQGQKMVRGNASTTVLMACQRCLEPMKLPLAVEMALGIVWSEDQAKSLPRELDPWIVEDEAGDITALVEDELLLALPFVMYHPEDQCNTAASYSTGEDLEDVAEENPFGVLAQLTREQLKDSSSDN